ncbi:Solute carrier family 12 member 2 [Toxocara canis]|uniref:Solute carrier family 12 member 3 n=1 Tax=Toxocara canis TaxID=6265 RepID=A0A0B2VC67_TOXCA|nr:Solute carrier family 12 member 2 [Toxocara canis]
MLPKEKDAIPAETVENDNKLSIEIAEKRKQVKSPQKDPPKERKLSKRKAEKTEAIETATAKEVNGAESQRTGLPVEKNKLRFPKKSIDQPPCIDNYDSSNVNRPSMRELIGAKKLNENIELKQKRLRSSSTASSLKSFDRTSGSFGWITGVLLRCILGILGATLFLRMSWLGGQAGLLLGACVIFLSFVVAMLTAISMSAIATNGEVKGGGCYYLISRSLGPEFGGSIGLIFYVANTVNASMNCVGLAEAIVFMLKDHGWTLIDGGTNDVRIYAFTVCLLLQCIIFIGTQFESKTQILLMVSLIVAMATNVVGTFLPPNAYQANRGITGYSWATARANLLPDFSNGQTFITVFGVYFPAMTGIMAGASMSGDLKDPSTSIPRGTILAILITTSIYALAMVLTTVTVVRDATGVSPPVFSNVTGKFIPPKCAAKHTCPFGLANDYQVMLLQGAFTPLVLMGIVASTLSSASGCLIGAPRVFQALCGDGIYPYLKFFSKGHGSNNEPYRAYVLTFIIASLMIFIGDLNLISIIITNFFLAAFAITNFACFDATQANSPGFRPGFRFYNKWLSLFGSVLCITIMFVLSWITALITFGIFILLFIYIRTKKSDINWGSSTQANSYRNALMGLLKLSQIEEHVKNYRPQLLVLTGNPSARQDLVDFAYAISKGQNLMICGHVVPYPPSVAATACIKKLNVDFTQWLNEHRIKAFYCAVANRSLRTGVQSLLQTVGLGKMQPNILLMGFKMSWLNKCLTDIDEVNDYIGVIRDAFESNMSLCIFRNRNDGFDQSVNLQSPDDYLFLKLPDLMLSDVKSSLSDDFSRGEFTRAKRPTTPTKSPKVAPFPPSASSSSRNPSTSSGPFMKDPSLKKQKRTTTKFTTKVKDGVIDVWWLYDDGGLTLLIPYLLSCQASYLQGAELRFFTISRNPMNVDEEHQKMERLLKKFRIDFSQVTVLCDEVEQQLYQETEDEYNEMIKSLTSKEGIISKQILSSNEMRTRRLLRSRELLLEHSSCSTLVVVTLPVAHKELVASPLYLLWLELLSRDLPPTFLVRGNQTSVLTFYS